MPVETVKIFKTSLQIYLMPFLRNIHRLSLALLLLACLLGSGSRSVSMPYAGQTAGTVQKADGEKAPLFADGQDIQDCLLHMHRPSPAGHSDHSQRNFTPGHVDHFRAAAATMADCSKSELRQRRRDTLAHFTYPQRLALYPRHWFW